MPAPTQGQHLLPGTNHLVCYYTNWTWYRPGDGKYDPSHIPQGTCTVIIYAFTTLDPNTLLMVPSDSWADIDNNFFEQVVEHKNYGSKVLIAIGGWNDSLNDKYYRLISNPAARQAFIADVIVFLQRWGFQGLDLDYEYPGCPQNGCVRPDEKGFFVDFVRELKEAFAQHGYLLSAAVSVNENTLNYGYDIPALNQHLSFINVMAYDLTGSWDGMTGHHGALHHAPEYMSDSRLNVDFGINYWISHGATPSKLMLGVPFYGQSFTLANPANTGMQSPSQGGAQAGEYTRQAGFFSYYEICQRTNTGWTTHQDPAYRFGPYSWLGNQWVGYDSTQMLERKVDYLKSKGLGGAMVWSLDMDDFRGTFCGAGPYPLLTALKRKLL